MLKLQSNFIEISLRHGCSTAASVYISLRKLKSRKSLHSFVAKQNRVRKSNFLFNPLIFCLTLNCKSMDWFLHDNGLRLERVKRLIAIIESNYSYLIKCM